MPLLLGAHDELIDDHLRRVHEIAELRLPDHERLRVFEAVAVLVAERGDLGQRAVLDLDGRLALRDRSEDRPRRARLRVVQATVALAEGAPRGVLSGEADPRPVRGEARERERLARGPVERAAAAGHLAAL